MTARKYEAFGHQVRLVCQCGIKATGSCRPARVRDTLIREFWRIHSGEGHGPKLGTSRVPVFKGRRIRLTIGMMKRRILAGG